MAMLSPIPPSGDRHHSLHSASGDMARLELVTYLRDELARLQEILTNSGNYEDIVRTQGAVQVVQELLEPLEKRPTHPRSGSPPDYNPHTPGRWGE